MVSPEVRAQQVPNTYWDGHLPVDVEAIAKKSGIDVRYDFPEVDEETGYDISGRIDTQDDGSRIITVSSIDHPERQRFTLAHELGHHFMNHGDRHRKDTFGAPPNNPEDRRKEWEANEFAAALLMPKKSIDLVIEKMEHPTVSKLADVFNVSEQAMRIRLQRLGILK